MSAWLDALVEDTSGDPEIEKVVRAKPARAVDACWDYDATRIDEPFTFDDPGSRWQRDLSRALEHEDGGRRAAHGGRDEMPAQTGQSS